MSIVPDLHSMQCIWFGLSDANWGLRHISYLAYTFRTPLTLQYFRLLSSTVHTQHCLWIKTCSHSLAIPSSRSNYWQCPICNNMWPSAFSILSFTSLGMRLPWNIDVHIVFCIQELAHILKLRCHATQWRPEHYYGTCNSSQQVCCHNCGYVA